MRAITRSNKNPLVIEYTAPQNIFFSTTLIEETTSREITDGIVIQSEYTMSQDQKSRYCLIADIPVKGRKYKIELFAKNKRTSEDDNKFYPMITEFIVIREGDEENIIPRYNLTFDYDLRLTSHFSSYIKFKSNPLVMEFEAPNNSQTAQKIFFSTTLIEERTNHVLPTMILLYKLLIIFSFFHFVNISFCAFSWKKDPPFILSFCHFVPFLGKKTPSFILSFCVFS